MSGPVAASGTVHWLGTGLSTGTGLAVVCDSAEQVMVWGRRQARVEQRLAQLGLGDRALARAGLDMATLSAELGAGDVVVSMLPAGEHAAVLQTCIAEGAHFACSSYASEPIPALAEGAARAGLVVLTEAGLDPGIDHLLAHRLITQARSELGDGAASVRFTSYCGGLPAVPNAFRYRFSWAPRGVLHALRSPARYVDGGSEKIAERPWEAVSRRLLGGEAFEAYPNRDSLPFVEQYGVPSSWRLETFVRGTLRLDGWSDAWGPVFDELRAGDRPRIDALADELAARYAAGADDRDRVVLAVSLDVRAETGEAWSSEYVLDTPGDATQSAMARCVSLPLSYGVDQILSGAMAPGLQRAAEDGADAERWLAFLDQHGVSCRRTPPLG